MAVHNKINRKKFLAATALTLSAMVTIPAAANADDTHAWVFQNGGGSFSTDVSLPDITTITQTTDRAIGIGNTSIAGNQTVNILQNGSGSLFVAKDNTGNASAILGRLNANGGVIVLNENGVIFGKTAVINVGSIVASTGHIDDAKFMAGDSHLELTDFGSGSIVNEGTINVSGAGLAALVAPSVVNNGIITAKLGKIALAAGGEKATVDLYGDGLIELTLGNAKTKALAENNGTLDGKTVLMTATAAKEAVDTIINMTGVIKANSVTEAGGKIILNGGASGSVKVTGTVEANGATKGGSVKVTGEKVYVSGTINANGLFGGDVTLWGDNRTYFSGVISALGTNGFVETSGGLLGVHGAVNLSEGGEWLLDPTDLWIMPGTANGGPDSSGGTFDPDDSLPPAPSGDSWYWVGVDYINAALNNGNSVVLQTHNNGTREGDIQINADIVKSGGTDASLTFRAHDDIYVNNSITSNSGKLNVTLYADYDGSGGDSNVNYNASILTNGGNINGMAPNSQNIASGVVLDAQGGNVNLQNAGVFTSVDANSVRTSGTGTINIAQNAGGSIQNAVAALSNSGFGANTVTVGNGTYNENVLIDQSNTNLVSVNGQSNTTINGVSNVGALGTVVIGDGANNVMLGGNAGVGGHGFTINGIDNGAAGIENAAVYLQGDHLATFILGNKIVAQGDEALVTEYGRNNSGLYIDGNEFAGNTFTGPDGAYGVGDQFTVDNVPRQLVALNQGISNLHFVNNKVTGNSGSQHLVAVEANGAQITGNTFDGATTNSVLRLRGSDITLADNDIDGNNTAENAVWASNVNGLTINGANDIHNADTGIYATNVNNLVINGGNNIHNAGSFGIFLDGGNVQTTRALIDGNILSDIGAHGIHTRDNQYATITNNSISNVNVGITTENFSQAAADGQRTLIDNNTINAKSIGIRNNLSYGTQSGFQISNNNITAADPSNTRRWTGIDVISQMDGTGTLFLNNHIDGFAVDGSRQTTGYELTNMTGADRAVIDGGDVRFVDTGIWVTDGSFYTGGVTDVLIQNVHFIANNTGILVEDTVDPLSQTGVNSTGTKVSVGTGNFFSTNHQIALAGTNVTVALENGFAGFQDVLVKAAGPANFAGNPSGTTTNLLTENASINQGVDIAAVGGTVHVDSGTFVEQVEVDKNIILEGDGAGLTTIQAPASMTMSGIPGFEPVLYVHDVTDAHIRNLTVDGANTAAIGIGYHNAGGIVSDAEVKNAYSNGIYAYNDTGVTTNLNVTGSNIHDVGGDTIAFYNQGLTGTISGNTLTGNGNAATWWQTGVLLAYGASGSVQNNTFSGFGNAAYTGYGVRLYQAGDDSEVSGNTITGTGFDYAVDTYATNKATIKDNTLDGNYLGVHLYSGDDVTVDNNTISNSTFRGIEADYITNLLVQNNDVYGTQGDAIDVFGSNGAKVLNNVIGALGNVSGYGIYLTGGTDGLIQGNTVSNVGLGGIYAVLADRTQVKSNVVNNTGLDGIALINTLNGVVSDNAVGFTTIAATTAAGNNNIKGDGIYVDGADGVVVKGNKVTETESTASNKGSGIQVVNTNGATIGGAGVGEANVITNTDWDGIRLQNVSNVSVLNNSINNVARVGIYGGNVNTATFDKNVLNNNHLAGYGALSMDGGSNFTITNNDIDNSAGHGIRLNGGTGTNKIDKNTVDYVAQDGILAQSTTNLTVSNNTVGGAHWFAGNGINLVNTNNASVKTNTIKSTGLAGIKVYGGVDSTYEGNTLEKIGQQGFLVAGQHKNLVISNNHLTNIGWTGLQIDDGVNGKVTGNDITKTGVAGMLISGVQVLEVSSNIVNDTGLASIIVNGGNKATVKNNTLTKAGTHGIQSGNVAVSLVLDNNTINTVAQDGIHVVNAANLQVINNKIGQTGTIGRNGIFVDPSNNAALTGNVIIGATLNGIYSLNNNDAVITKNTITGSGLDGILVVGGNNVTVGGSSANKNTVNNSGDDGIDVENTTGTVNISFNAIDTTAPGYTGTDGHNGIEVSGTTGAAIDSNTVKNAGWDGVNVQNTTGTKITSNKISDTKGASGIGVLASANTTIDKNEIRNSKQFGMYIGTNTGVLDITNNLVRGVTDSDGIYVAASNQPNITGNFIDGVNRDGISVDGNGSKATVVSNFVGLGKNGSVGGSGDNADSTIGRDGIRVTNSATSVINKNKVANTTGNGIDVLGSATAIIGGSGNADGNTVFNTALDGIHVENSGSVTVQKNTVYKDGDDGIDVANSASAQILSNKVGQSGASGLITDNGIEVTDSASVNISSNTVTNVGNNGIQIDPSPDSTIYGNTISGAVHNGIYSKDNDNITIGGFGAGQRNTISDVGDNGIYVLSSNTAAHKNDNATIQNNLISGAGIDGIQVKYGKDAVIDGNIIEGGNGSFTIFPPAAVNGKNGAGRDGIHVENNGNAVIKNNQIAGGTGAVLGSGVGGKGAANDAIFVKNSDLVQVLSNTVSGGLTIPVVGGKGGVGAGNNGVEVSGGKNALIDKNTVIGGLTPAGGGVQGVTNNGIHVIGNREAVITNNNILAGLAAGSEGAGHDGIYVDNSGAQGVFSARNGVVITGNNILGIAAKGAVNNGIYVNNSAGGLFGNAALVKSNTVTNVGNDGIIVNKTAGVNVLNNIVTKTGDEGIEVDNSDLAQILSNVVTGAGDVGILVDPSSFTLTDGNIITDSGSFGVQVYGGVSNVVSHNIITKTGDDGVRIDNNLNSKVLNNIITGSGKDGVEINGGVNLFGVLVGNNLVDGNVITSSGDDGVYVHGSALNKVTSNIITKTVNNGVNVYDADGIEVAKNIITLAGTDGVHVENSLLADIHNNIITSSGLNGIVLDGSLLAKIENNIVTLSGKDGIYVNNVAGLSVDKNVVSLSTEDGIDVRKVLGAKITNNIVTKTTTGDGIALRNSTLVNIDKNIVTAAANNGVYIDPSFGINVTGNVVTMSGVDGINAVDVIGLNILNNIVSFSGNDGVDVNNAALVNISDNIISASDNDGIRVNKTIGDLIAGNIIIGSGDNGIELTNSALAVIIDNDVALAGHDGINVDNSLLTAILGNRVGIVGNDGIHTNHGIGTLIAGNVVGLALDDGIDVNNSNGVVVGLNLVGLVGNNGIEADNTDNLAIGLNVVGLTGNDGIHVNHSDNLVVGLNVVGLTGGDGIQVDNVTDALVIANVVGLNGGNGVRSNHSDNLTIRDNIIGLTLNDGVHVNDANDLLIDNNIIGLTGGDGVDVRNSNGVVSDNTIGLNARDGIRAANVNGLIISNNNIDNVGRNGVHIRNSDNVQLLSNVISNSGSRGLYVSGQDNGSVVLKGNVFNNNPIGAEFETGLIDLTGTGTNRNIFNGGDVAMKFDPTVGGDPHKLVLVNDGNPAFGGTIGETEFNGQTTYYVELANGAFFDPGTPTIINGYHATFDGFRPDTVPFLTPAQFNAINAKLYDYRDDNTLGLFFFGSLPPDVDQKDLLKEFGTFGGTAGKFRVTILGLPRVSGGTGSFTGGGNIANLLASINPAAGGDDKAKGKAKTGVSDLVNLEPSAGPATQAASNDNGAEAAAADTACWSQAVARASTGSAVDYSFGGTMEEAITQTASCANGAQF